MGGSFFLAMRVQELKERVEMLSKKHVKFLKNMGMVVNTSKTEVIIFKKKGHRSIENFKVGGTEVKAIVTMKVLGLNFQTDIKWNTQVSTILSKIRPKLSILRKISRNLDIQDYHKVATVQLCSILYYGSPVWLNNTLDKSLWAKLRSLHYRILRVGIKDLKQRKSKLYIDKTYKRAISEMCRDSYPNSPNERAV